MPDNTNYFSPDMFDNDVELTKENCTPECFEALGGNLPPINPNEKKDENK